MSLAYRLSFTLPPVLAFSVPAGRHQPCLAGCMLEIDKRGVVTVTGPSREAVFEQAARFFRVIAKGHTAIEPIHAVLTTPPGAGVPAGSDGLNIVIGAAIAFSLTSRTPEIFPRLAPRPTYGSHRRRAAAGGGFVPTFV